MSKVILVINPGSTSTKYGIFDIEKKDMVIEKELLHSREELAPFEKITDQGEFREKIIVDAFKDAGYNISDLSAISARGGLLHPIPGSVYAVNQAMADDLSESKYGEHASNLGAIIALKLSKEANVPAFIVDSVSVNEMEGPAKVSGHPKIERIVRAHNLNIRRTAREVAHKIGKEFHEINMVGVHLGGGISVVAIKKGRFIDVNNALLGEGPFTTERAGTLPIEGLMDMCFNSGMTMAELKKEFTKKSGLMGYIGTSDLREVEDRVVAGDKDATFYLDAMAYRVAKSIGEMSTVLEGDVSAIFLTGGMARCPQLVEGIEKRVSFICQVVLFPGQFEMIALAEGAVMALEEKEEIHEYKKEL
ncbi:butyrate kinase [bacterium]|nr:butyrate kinase [bacterium]